MVAVSASAGAPAFQSNKKINSAYGYMIAFAAAMGGLLFGYEIGVVSQVFDMPGFKYTFGMVGRNADGTLFDIDKKTVPSLTTFTFLAGCFVGAAIVSYMADALGRKRSIMVGGLGFLIGGALQTFTSTTGPYYTGRVISGLGIGILSMCSPLYISEAAPTEIRGRMITVQQLMITIGIFVAASVNSIIIVTLGRTGMGSGFIDINKTDYDTEWRLAMGMQCVPAILMILVMSFMPESPRWLATRGRDQEALETVAKLRGETTSDEYAIAEFKHIQDSIRTEREIGNGSWGELFVPGLRNRLFIAVGLQFWQQWTGINVILYYQGDLLKGMGIDPDSAAITFTLLNDFINFIATFPGMYLIERMGRRKLLLMGGIGMGIAHFLVFTFIGLARSTGNGGLYWGAIFSVYLFFLNFASTWGPVVWAYQSEIFPLRVRAKGTGAGTMSNWGNNAIIALVSPYISDAIGPQQYLIFGSTGLAMAAFTYFFVPETMGKSLEDMDDVFGKPEAVKGYVDKK